MTRVPVTVVGRNPGFQKVSAVLLFQRSLGYSLSEAKKAEEAIIAEEEITFMVEVDAVDEFPRELISIGAILLD